MGELAAIADVLSKVGGYGIAALFIWLWIKERDRNNTVQDLRLSDWKERDERAIRTQEATVHALDKIEELIRSIKP